MSEDNLRGARVLVTRPAHQAEALAQLIESAGGVALRLPTVEIAAPADPAALDAVLDRLHEFAYAIFISPNAVIQAQHNFLWSTVCFIPRNPNAVGRAKFALGKVSRKLFGCKSKSFGGLAQVLVRLRFVGVVKPVDN